MFIFLSNLPADDGVIIQGDVAGDQLGISVSNAGDVNGDGIDDVIIGANFGDNGGENAGEAYIIYGGTDLTNIDLTTLDASQGFIVQGDVAGDVAAFSVSAAGDFNNDGYDDVIIGAPGSDVDGQANAGRAYIVFGGTNVSDVDLSTFSQSQGLSLIHI